MTSVANDLALALEMADAADALTLDRFGALDLRVETKPDLTPVTDADESAEELLRASLTAHRPDDSVFGEEFGGTAAFTGRQWVLDPIDGTKNFVRGVPVWCTLIALLVDGVPVVGVVSAPALGRRWWAGAGRRRVHVVRRCDSGASRSPESTTSPRPACRSPTSPGGATADRDSSSSPTRSGGYAPTAISGPTAWWPRVPSTSRPNRRSSCGTSAPLDILMREAGGTFTNFHGAPGPHGVSAVGDQRTAARRGAGQAQRGVSQRTFLFYLTPE